MTKMTMETKAISWTETWMSVAETIAKRSRCARAQVGAVIVDKDQRVRATGYNGPAATYPTNGDCLNWCERAQGKTGLGADYEGCPSIHAEANALLYVDRSAVNDGTIYITCAPCMQCAKLISNSGITKVVTRITEKDFHRKPEVVLDYLSKCGILIDLIP